MTRPCSSGVCDHRAGTIRLVVGKSLYPANETRAFKATAHFRRAVPMVTAATVANNRDVSATLKFISPTSKSNRRYVAPSQEAFTGEYEDKKVIIKDARPGRSDFSVETSGFALLDHKSRVFHLRND